MGGGPLTGALGFLALLVLMALRCPVGLAMLIGGGAGYVSILGWAPFLAYLKATPYHTFASYTLSVIPLFILMGALAERGGLSATLFDAANAVLGPVRGGVALAVVAACAMFGAICGSSVATTAAMGRAALPELKRFGYTARMATGTVAASGTLGILIPPSLILVLYAITTEQNIAKLFMAAFVPGLLAAALYMLVVVVIARLDPSAAPPGVVLPWAERWRRLMRIWPMLGIAVLVLGGIYGGVFTPTESASIGVGLTLLVVLARGSLGWRGLVQALAATAETSAMIFLVLLGAEVFNAFLALSGMPELLAASIAGLDLPAHGIVAAILVFYIVLGGVMDEIAMILLTLPIVFPIVMALDLGLDPEATALWFGILVLVTVGIGLTAPPIGLNVFVVRGIARDVPIATTYRGVLPFLAADMVRLALLTAFPALSLWLVRMLA